jgi:type IV pilus assembly protein PilV
MLRVQRNGFYCATPIGRAETGSSLIEILITVVILSFGMLSLAGMQAFAVGANKNINNRGLAIALAAYYAETIRANPNAFAAGNYDKAASFSATDASVPSVIAGDYCAFPNCTVAQVANYEQAMMNSRLKANLRAGTFALVRPVESGASSVTKADLWIMWHEQRGNATENSENSFDNCPGSIAAQSPLPRCFYMRVSL